MLVERKACCHVTNAFFSRLGLVWLILQNVQKRRFWQKATRVNMFIIVSKILQIDPSPSVKRPKPPYGRADEAFFVVSTSIAL